MEAVTSQPLRAQQHGKAVAVVVPKKPYEGGVSCPQEATQNLFAEQDMQGRVDLMSSRSSNGANKREKPFDVGPVKLIAIISAIAAAVLLSIGAGVFLIATAISIPLGITLIAVPIIVAATLIKCVFFKK